MKLVSNLPAFLDDEEEDGGAEQSLQAAGAESQRLKVQTEPIVTNQPSWCHKL